MAVGLDSEQKLALVNEFSALWKEFFRRFEEGMTSPELIPEMETEFLKLQSRIAMRRQMIEHVMADEFDCGGDAIKVLLGAVSLDQLRNESPITVNTLKTQWHEVFISLNKILGNLKEAVALTAAKKKKR